MEVDELERQTSELNHELLFWANSDKLKMGIEAPIPSPQLPVFVVDEANNGDSPYSRLIELARK